MARIRTLITAISVVAIAVVMALVFTVTDGSAAADRRPSSATPTATTFSYLRK